MEKELISQKEYKDWIIQLKKDIRLTQLKASIAVNEEMLILYWNIGKDICQKQLDSKYGSHFFEILSKDLRTDFPDAQGFSERNLRYMKQFYTFYSPILHQAGAESKSVNHQVCDDLEAKLFTIPWRHHVEIFTRSKTVDEALFFIEKTKKYNGYYHVLNGLISPIDGITPDELNIDSLIKRIQDYEKTLGVKLIDSIGTQMHIDNSITKEQIEVVLERLQKQDPQAYEKIQKLNKIYSPLLFNFETELKSLCEKLNSIEKTTKKENKTPCIESDRKKSMQSPER